MIVDLQYLAKNVRFFCWQCVEEKSKSYDLTKGELRDYAIKILPKCSSCGLKAQVVAIVSPKKQESAHALTIVFPGADKPTRVK